MGNNNSFLTFCRHPQIEKSNMCWIFLQKTPGCLGPKKISLKSPIDMCQHVNKDKFEKSQNLSYSKRCWILGLFKLIFLGRFNHHLKKIPTPFRCYSPPFAFGTQKVDIGAVDLFDQRHRQLSSFLDFDEVEFENDPGILNSSKHPISWCQWKSVVQ